MANTYFNLHKKEIYNDNVGSINNKFPSYTNEMSLSLTAFVSKNPNSLQLTVYIRSTLPNQSGTGYITLTQEEQDKLIEGILERRHFISATGDNKSNICPAE
jgi:hypothetical protein